MRSSSRSVEERLGYRFSDGRLLETSLTHRSAGSDHNERLEFLGDAVLDLVIAERLFHGRPDSNEGDLSRARARLVRQETLAQVAREVGLGDWLVLGSGEAGTGGHQRSSTLADALEAVIGAVYLDGGLEPARRLVLKLLEPKLSSLPDNAALKDAKTRLQEYLQSHGLPLPSYEIAESSGAEHERVFKVACRLGGRNQVFYGKGRSRRAAEQEAATRALDNLNAG